MTELKDYFAFAETIERLYRERGCPVMLTLTSRGMVRGRRDLDENDTFRYRVGYPNSLPNGTQGRDRDQQYWDFKFGMDADDQRLQTPERALVDGLNFGLERQGLEAVLRQGVASDEIAVIRRGRFKLDVQDGEILLRDMERVCAMQIPAETRKRWISCRVPPPQQLAEAVFDYLCAQERYP